MSDMRVGSRGCVFVWDMVVCSVGSISRSIDAGGTYKRCSCHLRHEWWCHGGAKVVSWWCHGVVHRDKRPAGATPKRLVLHLPYRDPPVLVFCQVRCAGNGFRTRGGTDSAPCDHPLPCPSLPRLDKDAS